MSDIPSRNDPAGRGDSAEPGPATDSVESRPARRKRRGLRIALVTMASFVVLIGAVAAGGYAYINHVAGSIQRMPVRFAKLDAASSNYGGAMTVLITGKGIGPTGATADLWELGGEAAVKCFDWLAPPSLRQIIRGQRLNRLISPE